MNEEVESADVPNQHNEEGIGDLEYITKPTDNENGEIENLLNLKRLLKNPVVILKIRMKKKVIIPK